VTGSPCAGLAELRSAYVDGALGDQDRERLLTHLIGCAACRADVAEMRAVRELLTHAGSQPAAPAALSQRLVSIAGAEAHEPLWTRPFRRTRTGSLPSPRRAIRLRTAAFSAAMGTLAVAAGGLGYLAAPASTVAVIADPGVEAQAEFSSMVTQFPLLGDAVGAVMLARTSRLTQSTVTQLPAGGYGSPHRSLSPTEARQVMTRASAAAGQVSYSGSQVFSTTLHGRAVTALIQVDARKGQGSRLSVYTEQGEQVLTGFVPAAASSRIVDGELLTLLERNYSLTGWTGATTAGRSATVVEASSATGMVAARWWIDDATGLLLRQETYDGNGAPTMAYGFTRITIASQHDFLEHLPPRLVVPLTTTTLTVSTAAELSAQGWSSPDQLAGLALVRLRSDRAEDPTALHLVYSDGINTVSVFEQQGRMAAAPTGWDWDPNLGAYLQHSASSLASWQSGSLVITVVTDGPARLLASAVASLPHRKPVQPTTMERVRAGWANIMAHVTR
jgi:Putative zinc-finger